MKVHVAIANAGYDILIGDGLLQSASAWQGLPKAQRAVIVSNPTVHALHGAALRQALAPHYGQIPSVHLPDGEQHKDWATLNRIFDHLLSAGCDRNTVLFALGGGVVGGVAERKPTSEVAKRFTLGSTSSSSAGSAPIQRAIVDAY